MTHSKANKTIEIANVSDAWDDSSEASLALATSEPGPMTVSKQVPTPLATEAPTTEVKTASEKLAEALAAEAELDILDELAEVEARLVARRKARADRQVLLSNSEAELKLADAKAHSEMLRHEAQTAKMLKEIEVETTKKIAAIEQESNTVTPLLDKALDAQSKASLAARIRAIEETTKAAEASYAIETVQELNAKKLLASKLAEADKSKAEIQEIIDRGVQAVNRLQLRSASQSEATAMGVTRKMETVETTVNS